MDEKAELLKRMKAALRQGRDQRKEDKLILSNYLERAHLEGDPETARYALDEASAQKMLHKITVHRQGERRIEELPVINEHEPHQKRPSIRAMKKSRSKGLSI